MIYTFLSEASKTRCLAIEERFGVTKILAKMTFRASDTEVSYRMINYLDQDKLLGDNRPGGNKGWRKFTLKQVLFMLLLVELKDFGFNQKSLQPLSAALLQTSEGNPEAHLLDNIINLSLSQVEINLAAYGDGSMAVFDPAYFGQFQTGQIQQPEIYKTHLSIRFNDVVNKLWSSLKMKPIEPKYSAALEYFELLKNAGRNANTAKEQKVIDALRNQDYLAVEVRKKDGQLHIMKVDRLENDVDSQEQVAKLINDKDYADIRLIKRDGKVVRLEAKDTIKL